MDYPFHPTGNACITRAQRRLPVWVPIALIVAVLAAATVAAISVQDTRSFAERHGSVTRSTAL